MDERLYTVQEAAEELEIYPQSVRRLIGRGMLDVLEGDDGFAVRPYQIRESEIRRYQRQRRRPGAPSPGLLSIPSKDRDNGWGYQCHVVEYIRDREDWTVVRFAQEMGVDVSTVYKVNSRDLPARPQYRAKAAAVLGVPVGELFTPTLDNRRETA